MDKYTKHFLLFCIGLTFILSAVLKAISINSFSQTVQLYCGLLGMDELSEYNKSLSIAIIVLELMIGIGAFVKPLQNIVICFCPFVLGFFTYITYINYYSLYGNIESCGCFGELVHLSPDESFYKNVVLLGMSLILFLINNMKMISKSLHHKIV